MLHILEILGDPSFWKGLWEETLRVLTSGTPPVYVQYLVVTVIYLAYLLFIHDPRRAKDMPLGKWIRNPTSIIYFIVMIAITAGVTDLAFSFANPEMLQEIKPTELPVLSNALRVE